MYVRDLEGNEYPLQATITQEYELNGNQFITLKILPTKVNLQFIHDLTEMWELIDDLDVTHKIIYYRKRGEGDSLSVEIKGIPLFFDKFDSDRIYEEYNQSMTALFCFNLIFQDTGYNFVLVDSFNAIQWEGFGKGNTRLTLFKNALNRYGAEFRIEGNTIYLQKLIGRDTNFMYRYRLNASNIVQENDASQLWTYAKGFGDYAEGDEENAKLKREYTSPLANIFGIRHAPPIYNGNITTEETMDAQLKQLVDESLKINVSATIHDLRNQGYTLAQPELGDRVFLIDERIGLNDEVRVCYIRITKDWKGNVLDLQLELGAESIRRRYQSNINESVQRINDLIGGRIQLPFNVLDEAVKEVTKIIIGNENSVFRYMENGVIGWNGDDPNYMTRYVGDAIGFSRDGGNTFETAMSAEAGIVANLIRSGSLLTNNVSIIGDSNYFFWDGTGLYAIDPTDVSKFVRLRSDGLFVAKGAITIERHDGFAVVDDGKLNGEFAVQSSNPPWRDTTDVNVRGQWIDVNSTDKRRIDRYTFNHMGRYLRLDISSYVAQGGGAQGTISVESVNGEELWSLTFNNGPQADAAQYLQSYNIDLGQPNGQVRSVAIRGRTSVSGYPMSLHIGRLSIWG